MLSYKRERPISLLDVVFGTIGTTLLFAIIWLGLDMLFATLTLLGYPFNLAGMVFIVLGFFLTSWCFRVVLMLPKKSILVTWGPWAHVRHPIFLAGLLLKLGVTMIIGTLLMFVGFAVYTLIEILGASFEEKNLRKRFPDEYEEYAKTVPSWLPSLRKERKL